MNGIPSGTSSLFIPMLLNLAGATTTEMPPSVTPTTPTPIVTETPSPTATLTPPPAGSVKITNIFYNGVKGSAEPDEYVEFQNQSGSAVELQGWTLSDVQNHVFTFPSFSMTAGQTCRVYTNESHPEYCGFSYGSASAIWNNTGDGATLRDAQNSLVDSYQYP